MAMRAMPVQRVSPLPCDSARLEVKPIIETDDETEVERIGEGCMQLACSEDPTSSTLARFLGCS
jgi:hypothetical protein